MSDTKSLDYERDESNIASKFIGNELFKHFREILDQLLHYRPKQPQKVFTKRSPKNELSISNQIDSYSFAQSQFTRLSNHSTIERNPEEAMRNLLESNRFFERIGIGLNNEEMYWIWFSMKILLNEKPSIQKVRFWGKIFGLKTSYYIIEVDSDTFDEFDANDSEFLKYQEAFPTEEDEMENQSIPINRKAAPDLIGTGVNQKIFFVSTGLNQSFVQLPLVTPEQIELSRRIQQFFTGDLEAPVKIEVNFSGVEKHLLRAQIQRISGATQIGPKNYFKISTIDEEQMGEETVDVNQMKLNINEDFQGNTLENLSLPNGQYWVHCVPFISQEKSEIRRVSDQTNPYLLSSIDQDTSINGLYPAWSINVASSLVPEYALVSIRSNRWPGAFIVGDRHHFDSIYIGWGMKNQLETHQAEMIDILPENEHVFSFMELDDPTVEEENERLKSSILFSPVEDEEFENDLE